MNFGVRLRELREERELTQEQVALAIHVGYSTYRKYETENTLPRVDVMMRLADLYGTTIDDMVPPSTTVVFRFDREDVKQLRAILDEEQCISKRDRLVEVIDRMISEREAAHRNPSISPELARDISNEKADNKIKIIQSKAEEDDLFFRGLRELMRLDEIYQKV